MRIPRLQIEANFEGRERNHYDVTQADLGFQQSQ